MATSSKRTPAPLTRDPDGTGPSVQGMLVTHYTGEDTSQLWVFRVPVEQEMAFHSFLSDDPKYAELLANLNKPGFVKLDKQAAVLKQAAENYAASRKRRNLSPSRVGWEAVPMKENSVVLWAGIHKVTECRKKGHARVVRYLRLQDIPSPEQLPANRTEEPDGPGCKWQGKAPFAATERHLKSQYGKKLRYGHNCETIPDEYQGYFTQHKPHPYTPQRRMGEFKTLMLPEAEKTEVQRHLEEFGWAVLPEVLNQDELKAANDAIVYATRIALLADRPNLPPGICERLSVLTNNQFVKLLYTDKELKDVRFFKTDDQGDERGVAYPTPGKRRMRQGASGMTNESGMLDLWAVDPTALCTVIERVCRDLNRQVAIGKERISARSNNSNQLSAHHDCPPFKKHRKQ